MNPAGDTAPRALYPPPNQQVGVCHNFSPGLKCPQAPLEPHTHFCAHTNHSGTTCAMSPEAPAPRQPGDTPGGTGDVLVAHASLCLCCRETSSCRPRGTQRMRSGGSRRGRIGLCLLPWSGRVGAGRAAESAAATSTAQRMRHRQVNIPLLQLLLGDWAPQLPLHGGPGLAPGGRRGVSAGLAAPTSCEGGKQSQGRARSPTSHHPARLQGGMHLPSQAMFLPHPAQTAGCPWIMGCPQTAVTGLHRPLSSLTRPGTEWQGYVSLC